MNITIHKDVEKYINYNNIKIIINCAAYTKVDKAESNFEIANQINHLDVANLALLAKKHNIKLVHISTDYVFDGTSQIPYKEVDTPNPKSVYGKTKLKGELAIQKINPTNSIIIRTSWLYSIIGNSFINKILELSKTNKKIKVISDQIGTPTNASDLALVILTILEKITNKTVQIYHYSNDGSCSWYDFAVEILRNKKMKTIIHGIKTSEFTSDVNRPAYSILNKNKIKTHFNLEIPFWKDSLGSALEKIKTLNQSPS